MIWIGRTVSADFIQKVFGVTTLEQVDPKTVILFILSTF